MTRKGETLHRVEDTFPPLRLLQLTGQYERCGSFMSRLSQSRKDKSMCQSERTSFFTLFTRGRLCSLDHSLTSGWPSSPLHGEKHAQV